MGGWGGIDNYNRFGLGGEEEREGNSITTLRGTDCIAAFILCEAVDQWLPSDTSHHSISDPGYPTSTAVEAVVGDPGRWTMGRVFWSGL